MVRNILLSLLPVILIGAILWFYIWMLIDVIKNPKLTSDMRIVWVIVVLIGGLLGAVIYYLVARSSKPGPTPGA